MIIERIENKTGAVGSRSKVPKKNKVMVILFEGKNLQILQFQFFRKMS